MNRVTKRTWLMGLFVLVLLGGMVFFWCDYALNAGNWVGFTGSPHIYNNSNIGCGTIVDRSGTMVLDLSETRVYAEDATTRKSMLHWLGDRNGFINAAAVSSYAGEMAGFDPINGVYNAPGTGGQAQLTLSAQVQNAALKALGDRKGTVGVYNYKTGEILCAVTTPTYDPDKVPDIAGDTSGKFDGVYLNRFVQSAYVPGSIFKLVTTAAALECVPGMDSFQYTCTGKVEYGTEAVTCEKAHGAQNLKQALANSCNCAYSQIAAKIGKKNMTEYVDKFQITQPLKFDGITTAKGNYDISETALVSFAWSCIGQFNDLVNPARYMTFMGAIAGGGSAAEPYLMESVRSGEETTYRAGKTSTGKLMSSAVASTLKEYMRNNVQAVYGDWNFPGMNVCAKSGTSELGGGQTSNAMFSGFVSDEQYPLAFIVIVENGGYGSRTCVPVLSEVLAACKTVLDAESVDW